MKIPMKITLGGNEMMVEMDGEVLTMSLNYEGKKFSVVIDGAKAVMGELQRLTGRKVWELKAAIEELCQRIMTAAMKTGKERVEISVATVESLLREYLPEAIAKQP
jgi:hypothetical protein